MAKIIRFPLKMKNGEECRTLDELRENFDLESILGYFMDGKLKTWLADRYYDEKAEAVAALSAGMPDLNAKLCEILEVEYVPEADETDLEVIQQRKEKLRILQSATADKEILDNIDLVAMNQDELFDVLDENPSKVYLYGEKFSIPFGKQNVCYIGIIQAPEVKLENGKSTADYEEAGITFENVTGIEIESDESSDESSLINAEVDQVQHAVTLKKREIDYSKHGGYCQNCGEPVSITDITCPSCGWAVGSGNQYCGTCGSLRLTGEIICGICGMSLLSTSINSRKKGGFFGSLFGL